jgi:PKD repeat protein
MFLLSNRILIFFCFFLFNGTTYGQNLPTSITNLFIWLAADSGVVLDGGAVQQWNDLSGNGNNFYAPTVAFRPALNSSSILNNKPSLEFNGFKKMESFSSFSFGNFTAFIVASHNTGDVNFARLLDHSYNTGFWIGKGSGNNVGGGTLEVNAPFGNFQSVAFNQPFILNMFRSGASTSSFLNGVAFNPVSRNTGSAPTALNKIIIGATLQNGDFGRKKIYEIIIFNRALTLTERSTIETYLRTKYASPLSLGPDIVQNTLCSSVLNAPAGFTNLLWSNGATTSSISVNQPGTYWLQGTDIFGFVSRDTIVVNQPQISSPSNTNICFNDSITWNPQVGVGFSYLWSTGATSATLSISTPGSYSVQVTDAQGCVKNSDTLLFVMDNYPLTASLGSDTTFCSGNFIQLQVGASETVAYQWQGAIVPSAQAAYPITASGTYFLQATNTNGCVAVDTIEVLVSGVAPQVNFTAANTCATVANLFTDASSAAQGDDLESWTWNFGDGSGATLQNPTHAFAAPGNYLVELYVESEGGCGALHTQNVTIYALPNASFAYAGICTGDSTQFTSNSAPGDAAITSYAWDFGQPSLGAGNISVFENPKQVFQQAGMYPVTLVVTDQNGCVDDTVQQVEWKLSPLASMVLDEACVGGLVSVSNNSVTPAGSLFAWNFGDNTTSIFSVPQKTYNQAGNFTVSLVVTAPNGCISTTNVPLTIHPNPVASFDLGPYCSGSYMSLTSTSTVASGSVSQAQWTIDQMDTLTGLNANYLMQGLGQHQVEMLVTSSFGCTAYVSEFIDVTTVLDASFSVVSTIVASNEALSFINTTTGNTVYLWNFGDGTIINAVSPTHVYTSDWEDTTLLVSLIALNTIGCVDTAFQTISIFPKRIDLEVKNIYTEQNGNSSIVGVELRNLGTATLGKIHLNLRSENGYLFTETWQGQLVPNGYLIYVFSAQPSSFISSYDGQSSFYCIDAIGFSTAQEEETALENNVSCINREDNLLVLLPIIPNPAQSELDIRLYLPLASSVKVELIDYQGKLVKNLVSQQTLPAGVHSFQTDIRTVLPGMYLVRLQSGDHVQLQKLQVIAE